MAKSKSLVPRNNTHLLEWTRKKLPPYLTRDEVHSVLEGVRHRPLDHLLIAFLWHTGARVTEALCVTASDVDFYAKFVRLPSLKRRRPETKTVPLKGEILGEIGARMGHQGLSKGDRIFPVTRQHAHRIVRDAALGAGIERERAHPHVLRHSFAVNAVLQRVPINVVQQWMGHADVQTTMVYLKILSEDTRDFYEGLEF